jgi:redox-sensing transcriptional repressor
LTEGWKVPYSRKISESTIHRLSHYYRTLSILEKEDYETISSKELAKREELTPAQVRKDLSFFGSFGTRGLGYPVRELRQKIAKILGIDRSWNVALVGVGNIGSALVSYKEFAKQGFEIKLLFDSDQRKIGSNHKGIVVHDMRDLEKELKANKIDIVIVAVPSAAAQTIVDNVVHCGIKAILNFAPLKLKVPDGVFYRSENMAMELEYLSFALANFNNRSDRKKA